MVDIHLHPAYLHVGEEMLKIVTQKGGEEERNKGSQGAINMGRRQDPFREIKLIMKEMEKNTEQLLRKRGR